MYCFGIILLLVITSLLLLVVYTIISHYSITGNDIVSFYDMVQGKDTSEICRMFAASLQLVHIFYFNSSLSLIIIII